ncbi:MAG: hypothetical protein V3U11_00845, partial [Planctomycetota bacterium]
MTSPRLPRALLALPVGLAVLVYLACDVDPVAQQRPATAGAQEQEPQKTQFQKPNVTGAPELTMRISGYMMGRLTPCGCASGQFGGLPRRVFNLKADRNHELLIEGGRIIDGSHGVTDLDMEK